MDQLLWMKRNTGRVGAIRPPRRDLIAPILALLLAFPSGAGLAYHRCYGIGAVCHASTDIRLSCTCATDRNLAHADRNEP